MRRYERLILLGVAIGILSGIAAVALYYSIEFVKDVLIKMVVGYSATGAFERPYLIPVVMGAAGLLGGYIAYRFSKETEGHGADAVIKSFHTKHGQIRERVVLLELVNSSLTMGSGGSAGGEGPIALMCASLGSTFSKFLHLDEEDRRIISAVAVGSGIAAILKAPLGSALFGAEFLYKRDMEVKAVYPSLVASIISFAIYGAFVGYTPLFGDLTYTLSLNLIPFFIIVGLASGLFARLYIKTYHALSGWFHKLKLREYLKPAIGALFASFIIMEVPSTIGEGISWMQAMASDHLAKFVFVHGVPIAAFFLMLAVLKMIATSLTVGSGASGGVFVPGLFIGGSFGIGTGLILNMLFPQVVTMGMVGVFAIVCMVAFFGSTAKTPISLAIIGVELVGDLNLLTFIILAIFAAYLVSGNDTIFRSQVDDKDIDILVEPNAGTQVHTGTHG